jgi:hypothetical protein
MEKKHAELESYISNSGTKAGRSRKKTIKNGEKIERYIIPEDEATDIINKTERMIDRIENQNRVSQLIDMLIFASILFIFILLAAIVDSISVF